MSNNYNDILDFSELHVLVVGDIMMDRYLIGTVERQSPEADVPVVLQDQMEERLGGAANVALNVKNLGAKTSLCGIIGEDEAGAKIGSLLNQRDIGSKLVFHSPERITTTKTRVLDRNKHLLRVDREVSSELDKAFANKIIKSIKAFHLFENLDLIILQDYNKGFLSSHLILEIIQFSKSQNIKISVDPKQANFFAYRSVDLFKPNLKEIFNAFGQTPEYSKEKIQGLGTELKDRLNVTNLIVTLSEHGVYFKNDQEEGFVPTVEIKNADVCGAGDAVISLASLLLLKDISLEEISQITNFGGAQICLSPGIVPIQKPQLIQKLQEVRSD